jgi:RNA polymerase sigma-70 factor (ECF subfamily)
MPIEERIEELLARGDTRGAATEAIRSFGPRVLGYLRAILRNPSDADEAFSIFAESLWRGIGTFRHECAFRTWAYTLAWNAAARLRDDAYRRHARTLGPTAASELADAIRTTSALRHERQVSAMERLREALTPEEQSILVLRIDQGLSWEEVALVLHGSGGSAETAALRKRFERLKARLAQMARDSGLLG